MPPPTNRYVPQRTLQYSTFIKRGIIESLQAAFIDHPDKLVKSTKVALDSTHDRFSLPAVIIKFYEREMPNAGVGHVEYLPSPQDPNPDAPTLFIKYYHRLYKGDISFEVYGQSAVDRDVVRDGLIEVLAMTDTTEHGNDFLERFYASLTSTPYGTWHFPVLNLDLITGYGEQQMLAPWAAEDVYVYQVSYRVPIFGEFYSPTPVLPAALGLLEEVDVYPYIKGIDPDPENARPEDWYRFTGWPAGTQEI